MRCLRKNTKNSSWNVTVRWCSSCSAMYRPTRSLFDSLTLAIPLILTGLAEAPAKIAAECLAPERSARLAPDLPAEKRILKLPRSYVGKYGSTKTKTFLFSPSVLNCCDANIGLRLERNLRNLSHCLLRQKPAYGSTFLHFWFRFRVSKNQARYPKNPSVKKIASV